MHPSLTEATIASWPEFTSDRPLRVMVSGCLVGRPCAAEASSRGAHRTCAALLTLPKVRAIDFCPGDFAFGRPRVTPGIRGGDGFDVLDRRARVVSNDGVDWTEGILFAAQRMLDLARHHGVHFALMKDLSAACGPTVIQDGTLTRRAYRSGPGVAAALLARAGIPVVSEHDRVLDLVFAKLGSPDLIPMKPAEQIGQETGSYAVSC